MNDDLLNQFLAQPSGELYAALRAIVLLEPSYQFQTQDYEEMASLIEADEHAAAIAMMPLLSPNWLLSPGMHQLAGDAAQAAGDAATAASEHYLARAMLLGLMASGDGTQLRPYLVTHVADEFDLLDALDKDAVEQRHVATADGSFDVHTCTDGSQVWCAIPS